MISIDGRTYFDNELAADGHYIIAGKTNDLFCCDDLVLSDILRAMHWQLRNNEGFDAVFIYDRRNMLYCFDRQSFDILRYGDIHIADDAPYSPQSASPSGTGAPQPAEPLVAEGPLGHRHRRRQRAAAAPAAAPHPASGADESVELGMGRMSIPAAWQQVLGVLRQTTRRCALVISDASQMEGDQDALLDLAPYLAENHSVILYVFREGTLANADRWTGFARNVLLPRIGTDGAPDRVISIGCPNELEVRNLLNCMRFDEKNPVHVRQTEILDIAANLAQVCAKENIGLQKLRERIRGYADRHSDAELTLQSWQDFFYSGRVGSAADRRTALQKIDSLIGMDSVKAWMHERHDYFISQGSHHARPSGSSRLLPPPSSGVSSSGFDLNVALKGSAGTGKTTVAENIGELYYELGLLPKSHTITRKASELISPNVGQSAVLVRQAVREAMGGVLFIDEAYSLLDNQHGTDVIDELVNEMSSFAGQFAVVMAGYPDSMDRLLEANEGLRSRFGTQLVLPDYTPQQMQQIFMGLVQRGGYMLDKALSERLDDFFEAWVSGASVDHAWGNGREAGKLLDAMKNHAGARAVREGRLGSADPKLLTADDVPEDLQHCLKRRSHDVDEALDRIDHHMIGLGNVKRFLKTLVQNIKMGAWDGVPGNFIFTGNPGTGKTTVARQMGELLGLLHVLKRRVNNVTEVKAASLLNGEIALEDAVSRARGGVFFLDEAHQLAGSEEGREIIRALVPLIEDPDIHGDTCFICAGYPVEMRRFMEADQGLERRFPAQNRIRFYDYTASELMQILEQMAKASGKNPSPAYLERAQLALEQYMAQRPANFGNGGFIRDVFLPKSVSAHTRRLCTEITGSPDGIPTDEQIASLPDAIRNELDTLGEWDLPPEFEKLAGPHGKRPSGDRSALSKVESLVGKDEIVAYAKARAAGGDVDSFFGEGSNTGLNYAITGPLGSGRHTAARALAGLWRELGLLENDEPVFANPGNLIGQYIGSTAPKTRGVIERAVGTTLVVESPSALLPRGNTDASYGPEALQEIAAGMSEHLDDLSFVFIDSPDGLENVFQFMPGLKGQVGRVFELEDLTPDQMYQIFREKTGESMSFEDIGEGLLHDFFRNWVSDRGGLDDASGSWGNGLEVDKLINDLRIVWKNKGGETIEDHIPQEGSDGYVLKRRRILAEHFPNRLRGYLRETTEVSAEAMHELESLPGLGSVKSSIENIERRIRWSGQEHVKPGCYLYLGNPGVGKTTVARLMGGVLKAAGVLSQGHVVERTASRIARELERFDATVKLARGGILFIDEAHQLADPNNRWGAEVIKQLLRILEDNEVTDETAIILAGYPGPMRYLLSQDDGLQSRFGSEDNIINFEDYTPDELLQVMDFMAQRADRISQIGSSHPLSLSAGFRDRSLAVFAGVVASHDRTFGNARFVRSYLHDALGTQIRRLDSLYPGPEGLDDEVLYTIEEADVPKRYLPLLSEQRHHQVQLHPDMLNISSGQRIGKTGESLNDACKRLERSTVFIVCLAADGTEMGSASGFIISQNGYVLTCAHVVKEAASFSVRIWCPGAPGGDVRWVDAEAADPIYDEGDMAILYLEGSNYETMPLRPAEGPAPYSGEEIVLLGYPFGSRLSQGNDDALRASSMPGRISSIQQVSSEVEICYIDCTALFGNSGSPVISCDDGRVVGVFSGSRGYKGQNGFTEEMNFFYPISLFWNEFVEQDGAGK